MAKLKAPLFALKATGRLGKFLTLAKRQGRHIIERRPIPTDAKSSSQLFSRLMFNKCIDLWHLLSDAERQEWESLARSRHMTGYAWYISQCLRPNPGIYLPLIGGTMTGDIDMATNRILELPDPLVNQEAATKAYADTHGMQAHEHTHTAGQSDEIDSPLAAGAIPRHGKEKMQWALNKLLLGAGAGADPTEIAIPAGVPSGLILIWHGLIANIPAGYVICDGNNSTPNLLARFLQEVATAATDPGATGGSATHTLSVAELASHKHTVHQTTGPGGIPPAGTGNAAGTSDTSNTGSSSAHQNEPAFYDVAFLMKT